MNFPLGEAAVAGAIGLADGAISATDAKAGRVDFSKQHSTWVLGGILGLAVVVELANIRSIKPSVTTPALTTPLALLARRASFSAVIKGTMSGTPPMQVPAYGMVGAPRLFAGADDAGAGDGGSSSYGAGRIGGRSGGRPGMPYLRQSTIPAI